MRILAAAAKPPRTTRCFPAPYHLSTTTTTSTSSSQHCSSYDPTAQFLPSHSHHHRLLSHALTSPSPHPVRFAAASRLAASSPALRPFASILLAALLPGASPDLLAWCGSRGGSGRYAFLAAGMASEGFDVLARVRRGGKTPSLSALASLLRLLFRGGEVRTAWKVFEEMAARGPRPSLATFNAMILGFCHRGLVRVGAGLLAVMGRFRIVPDPCSYNILIKGHCVFGRADDAFKLFDEMCKSGCEPTVVMYNILVNVLCRDGNMVEARKLFDEMVKVGIEANTITFNVLIDGYAKAGRMDEANAACREMKRSSCFSFRIKFEELGCRKTEQR